MAKREASQGRGGWNSPVRSNDKAPIAGCFQNLKQMLCSFILNVLLQKAYDLIRSIIEGKVFLNVSTFSKNLRRQWGVNPPPSNPNFGYSDVSRSYIVTARTVSSFYLREVLFLGVCANSF